VIIPRNIERLLIVAPSWIGDAVMANVMYRAARNACPDARIHLASRAYLHPLLNGLPWFDRLEALDMSGLLGPVRAGRSFAQEHPDAVILLPGSFRSAMMAWWTRASLRIGTNRDGRGMLLTHAVPDADRSQPVSAIEQYRRLAKACFGDDAAEDAALELVATPEDDAEADRVLGSDQAPLLLLVPGANREDKRWPVERFATVADALHESHGLRPVITGAPGEADLAAELARSLRCDAVDAVAAGLKLGALKSVAGRARLAIVNDTGPRHVAAAMGTPLVSLFGPTDHRWAHLPGIREHRLLGDPFLPEEAMADRHPARCSIERITVADVSAAARALLDAGRNPGN